MTDCARCFKPLDARGFCIRCQAAEVRCPHCRKVIKDGPNDEFVNWQVCRSCLLSVAAANRLMKETR